MMKLMKRMCRVILMMTALLLAMSACALAQGRTGTAVTTDYVQLLAQPSDGAQVLMSYYPGVRVFVEEEISDTVARVRIGAPGGQIQGYMPTALLAFGEESIRRVMPMMVRYRAQRSMKLYSACSEEAERVGDVMELGGLHVIGGNEEWLHVYIHPMMTDTAFVHIEGEDIELIQSTPMSYAYTFPMEDELPIAQAEEIGRTYVMEHGTPGSGMNFEGLTAEMLARCTADTRILYEPNIPGTLLYEITYVRPDGVMEGPYIYAWIVLRVKGMEILEYGYGNG